MNKCDATRTELSYFAAAETVSASCNKFYRKSVVMCLVYK